MFWISSLGDLIKVKFCFVLIIYLYSMLGSHALPDFFMQFFYRISSRVLADPGVGGLNKAAAALCAAWFFCAHPSLEQAPLGISTKKPLNFRWAAACVGREDRIRTCDPLVPNQVRYRPALLPDHGFYADALWKKSGEGGIRTRGTE